MPATNEDILSEHTSRPDTFSVLWAGEHLALIKSKAGKDYRGHYEHAQVRLVSHSYGRKDWVTKVRLDGPSGMLRDTVWTCDRRRERPEENQGRMTPTVIARLIAEAKSYEAEVWPGILAERLAEEKAREAVHAAEKATEKALAARNAVVGDALGALMTAALDGDAIAILQAAAAYRETRAAQEAA